MMGKVGVSIIRSKMVPKRMMLIAIDSLLNSSPTDGLKLHWVVKLG